MRIQVLVATLAVALIGFASCGERSYEDYLGDISKAACESADKCDKIGENQAIHDFDECISDVESSFRNLWPRSQCDGGRINEDKFESCVNRAELLYCDGKVLDLLSGLAACNAKEVCID